MASRVTAAQPTVSACITHFHPGLVHVLMGRVSLEEAITVFPLPGTETALHFMPSGAYPPNPSEALGSDRMRTLLDELRERYDAIIFDAPPLNLVTDAALLGKRADAVVLVARAGVTERNALHRAFSQLEQLQAPLIGVILNDFHTAPTGYYGNAVSPTPS